MAWSNDDSGNRGGDFGGVDGGFSGGFGEGGPGGDGEGSRGVGTTHDSDSDNNGTPRTGTKTSTADTTSSDSSEPRTSTRAAREDVTARRDAFGLESALSAFDLAQDVSIEAAPQVDGVRSFGVPQTTHARQADGTVGFGTNLKDIGSSGYEAWAANPEMAKHYADQPKSVHDTISRGVAANEPNGMLPTLANVAIPGAGLLASAAINARQADQFSQEAWNIDRGWQDNIADGIVATAPGAVGGAVGGKVGLLAGSAFGPTGMMIGAVGGQMLGSKLGNSSVGSGPPTYSEPFQPDYGSGSDSKMTQGLLNPAVVDAAPTGYNSSFGDYASHLNKGYGFRGAFDAFS